MDNECIFCSRSKNNILSTSNFFLYLDDSPLTEGHCLICTQQHIPSFADLNTDLYTELIDVLAIVRATLDDVYGHCIFFEHGRTASCVTKNPNERYCHHAHIHAIPVNIDLPAVVSATLPRIEIKSISQLALQQYDGYLFTESHLQIKYIFPVIRQIPAHFLRTCVASKLGDPSLADWEQNIGSDASMEKIKAAKHKFRKSLNSQKTKQTVNCYNQMAEIFFNQTKNTDMEFIYQPFLELLPENAIILDAGCGSGRDIVNFTRRGYKTIGFDASENVVRLASNFSGQQILKMSFDDLNFSEEFDGIWACASLLHIPLGELDQIFDKLIRALKINGVWFMSFKLDCHGETLIHHTELNGFRLFNALRSDELMDLINSHLNICLVKIWESDDNRPNRDTKWLNAIVRRIK